jgi:hypothetical protein
MDLWVSEEFKCLPSVAARPVRKTVDPIQLEIVEKKILLMTVDSTSYEMTCLPVLRFQQQRAK